MIASVCSVLMVYLILQQSQYFICSHNIHPQHTKTVTCKSIQVNNCLQHKTGHHDRGIIVKPDGMFDMLNVGWVLILLDLMDMNQTIAQSQSSQDMVTLSLLEQYHWFVIAIDFGTLSSYAFCWYVGLINKFWVLICICNQINDTFTLLEMPWTDVPLRWSGKYSRTTKNIIY